jgi:DNA-binding XRE family transcriptional regulator
MSKMKISPSGSSWDDFERQMYTPEEIEASKVRSEIITEMIKAREEGGVTQKQLEIMSGIKQPVISRMEKGTTDPQLSTVLKVLNSLGKTLEVVSMKPVK